jgi:GNAT superfamily N-acetyltransferase
VLRYHIRPATSADEAFLRDMLYHAIHVPEGHPAPPHDVVYRPEIAKYVSDRGAPNDIGFIAVDAESQQPMGATWLRLFTSENRGFGYVDDATPELTIAILPGYRGQGIGTALLTHLLEAARGRYAAVSLSVARENPARRLYERLGFEVVGTRGTSLTMRKSLV